ncbi:cyclopropane-fatty-acyl-phospholipid synthase [Haloechinothrix alba]|uniref:Cyclopropane-fatty-acyl-phospholipid synthase n=1 Tax=Haloechinothrix alba TaxID=664784 RepID=A0A238X6Q7_9PSEU|nr:cyclopropane-fatty-acyl-phospholipid synthase family protein [Haloechinothrix alba]SNR54261.1 cyclopropane-fatty-acyl-phospholipid synthase [Haloechinothrix alba]
MRLADVFMRMVGEGADVEFRAYDGSRAGPRSASVAIEVRSPLAVSYLASAPGELGLSRAYITGCLDVVGDLYTALLRLQNVAFGRLSPALRARVAAQLAWSLARWPAKRPQVEARVHGFRHSRARDQAAIAHHYDVSNRFYEWILGPSMTYTCAVYPAEDASLEDAQFEKHDLVARKLGLTPGMRLLDVGCGWGGMVIHAARRYGVRALGVTLSRMQAEWAQKQIAAEGLGDLAEVRHLDYRSVTEDEFDAISSIGLTEHIGKAQLGNYFDELYAKLRPGGRLLNHCITRADNSRPSRVRGFFNRYIFPDGELLSPGYIISTMHDRGFEVRHEENFREHYARTLSAWASNLDAHWDDAVAEVGVERARTWRLYLNASRLGFERNNIQLHQVIGVRLDDARSGMPLRPDW